MAQSPTDAIGAGSRSLRPYGTGFVLSLVLTAAPFAIVMSGALSRQAALWVIFSAAFVQILVHLRFFLHVNVSAGSRWHILALLLAALVTVLVVAGTVWIMAHLDYNLS